jgi:hypothetical protein
MTDDALDPLIHAPARLRIVVTLAALRQGDRDHPSVTAIAAACLNGWSRLRG